jgi:HD-like signal output (HDOD) protein
MNANVLEAIKRSASVPSMPQVVSRFLEIMQDPEFDYGDVVRILSADAGTVSEILRLVNSALFGMRQRVVSLRQALTLLGPKRTRSLLLGRYLVDAIGSKSVSGLDMTYFWRRSLASSVVASRLADQVIPHMREEAFVASLLSGIGVPILAEAMSDAYAPILAKIVPNGDWVTADEERAAVGVAHSEVSAMVLTHWSLPDLVTQAVNLYQARKPGDSEAAKLARVLYAGDRIAKLLCEIPDVDQAAIICSEATTFVGVDASALVNMLTTIEGDIEELAQALRIDVIPSSVYAMIAKSVQERLCAPSNT